MTKGARKGKGGGKSKNDRSGRDGADPISHPKRRLRVLVCRVEREDIDEDRICYETRKRECGSYQSTCKLQCGGIVVEAPGMLVMNELGAEDSAACAAFDYLSAQLPTCPGNDIKFKLILSGVYRQRAGAEARQGDILYEVMKEGRSFRGTCTIPAFSISVKGELRGVEKDAEISAAEAACISLGAHPVHADKTYAVGEIPAKFPNDAEIAQLRALEMPDKSRVFSHLTGSSFRFEELLGPNFTMVRKGSVWNHEVQHISDLDVLFASKRENLDVDVMEFLEHAPEHIVHFRSKLIGMKNGETTVEEMSAVETKSAVENYASGLFTAVLTFVYTMGKWRFPLDVTLTSTDDTEQSVDARVGEIVRNVSEANFAKALQRFRPLLHRLGKKRTKCAQERMLSESNARIGRVRFLNKQFEMMCQCQQGELRAEWQLYLHDVLGFQYENMEEVCAAYERWKCENSRRALQILRDLREIILDAISETHLAADIGALLTALCRDASDEKNAPEHKPPDLADESIAKRQKVS